MAKTKRTTTPRLTPEMIEWVKETVAPAVYFGIEARPNEPITAIDHMVETILKRESDGGGAALYPEAPPMRDIDFTYPTIAEAVEAVAVISAWAAREDRACRWSISGGVVLVPHPPQTPTH